MVPPPSPLDRQASHHSHSHHHHHPAASKQAIHGNPFILTLNDKQQAALAQFKSTLEGKGAYVPLNVGEGKAASVDDLMLVRFLKARRWDPAAATTQFLATVEWRKKHGVDQLYREEVDPEEYEIWKQTYPKWTGRRDKHGNPLYVYKLSVLTSSVLKELGKVPEEVRYRRIVALYELLHNLAFPMCLSVPIYPPLLPPGELPTEPPLPPAPLPPNSLRLIQNTTIIDFSATSLGSMFSFRHHLAQASTLAQANHPETLGSIFVVGAPGWWSTVWGWIKNWFDEQTRAKVHIVPAGSSELLEVIPKENLPKAYGGELEWVYEDELVWDADMDWLLKDAGVPEEGGKRRLRGPVMVMPRTEARPIEVHLVGEGRDEVYTGTGDVPAAVEGSAELPASTSTLEPLQVPQAPEVGSDIPLTPGGPRTPAANLAPLPESNLVDPSAAEVAAANGAAPELTAEEEGGFRPSPMGPGLGPATPGTPGFVPDLPGGILASGQGDKDKQVEEVVQKVAEVQV